MMEYHIIERFLRHTLVHITILQYSTRPMAIDSYIINLNLVPTRRIYRFLYYRLKLSPYTENFNRFLYYRLKLSPFNENFNRFLYYRLKLNLHIEFKILSRRTGIKESYLYQEKSQTVSR